MKVLLALEIPAAPRYFPKEEKWRKNGKGNQGQDRMVAHTRPQVHVLAHLAYKLVYQQHELTHMGKTALETLLGPYYLVAHLPALCSVSQRCVICLQNNPYQGPSRLAGTKHCGLSSFEDMEPGFTEITPNQGFRYLLVFICTFSGWVEAFPT